MKKFNDYIVNDIKLEKWNKEENKWDIINENENENKIHNPATFHYLNNNYFTDEFYTYNYYVNENGFAYIYIFNNILLNNFDILMSITIYDENNNIVEKALNNISKLIWRDMVTSFDLSLSIYIKKGWKISCYYSQATSYNKIFYLKLDKNFIQFNEEGNIIENENKKI